MSYVSATGYRRIKAAGHPVADRWGWAVEHRVVAWDHYGPFPRDRHVHHINGDKLDNRPENLAVVTTAEHGEEHRSLDRDYLRRRYEAGTNTVQLSRETGHNPGAIYRAIASTGCRMRSLSEAKTTRLDDKRLIELHSRPGYRVPQIARELAVGESVVRRRMRQLGLPSFPVGRP